MPAAAAKGDFQTNNLVIDGVLYTASPARHVIALDAATGKEIWRFDPRTEREDAVGNRQRGLAYWADGDDRRIFTSAGTWLYALDARTGTPVRTFGDNGSIHLGRGLGLGGTPSIRLNTPGVVYRNLLIVGGLIPENVSGGIRAFDVRTGELKWTFRTIPRPGEYGYETWPADAWKTAGGASDWSGHSVDEARGIVYVSTETAGPDFWGGDRYGENLFANSVIALDANTGTAPVALPDRPPRPLGSGPAGAPDAAHRDARRQAHRRRGARHQARPAVCLRPGDGHPAVAGS